MTPRQVNIALIAVGLCIMGVFAPSEGARAALFFAAGACAHRAYWEGED